MSGGIDSAVAALLLRRAGHDVTGVFMRNGVHVEESTQKSCCSVGDAYDARRIADRLGFPFYAVNFADGFEGIIRNFVDEYNAGRTPNPCVLCNRDLKFGRLLQFSDSLGIRTIATGHYARLEPRSGRTALRRARDAKKDQTYMLFALSQAQLSRTLFPLGGLEKPEVRSIAREAGLSIADKPESQEICFVPAGDYRELLRGRTPEAFGEGEFRTTDGELLGTHGGHQNFTVGQRRGLGVAAGRRLYVVRIEPETNTVVLGDEDELRRGEMAVGRVNWVSIDAPTAPVSAQVRIRHGHEPVPATLTAEAGGRVRAVFKEPQKIVTPGQAAVFYDGDLVLGGGWIE